MGASPPTVRKGGSPLVQIWSNSHIVCREFGVFRSIFDDGGVALSSSRRVVHRPSPITRSSPGGVKVKDPFRTARTSPTSSRDSPMRKRRYYISLSSVQRSLSLLRNRQFIQQSRLKAFHATWCLTKQLDFPPLADGVRRDVEPFSELRPARVVAHSIPSEPGAQQMAPAGVIAHSCPHFIALLSISPSLASAIFFTLLLLATPALWLGVVAGSWLRSKACVSPLLCFSVLRSTTLRVLVFIDFACCLFVKVGSAPDPLISLPRWLCCGLAACCAALVVYTGCRLSEHTCQTGSMPRRAGQLGPTVIVFGQSEALHSEVHGPRLTCG